MLKDGKDIDRGFFTLYKGRRHGFEFYLLEVFIRQVFACITRDYDLRPHFLCQGLKP